MFFKNSHLIYSHMFNNRWYFFLNRKDEKNLVDNEKCLLDDQDSIVVSNWTKLKQYTVFKSHIQLYNYLFSIPKDQRCFFETLLPHMGRKMYFDIDMERLQLEHLLACHKSEKR